MNIKSIVSELNIKEWQFDKAESLLQEGATLPFIARYRKDFTGGLTDIELEKIVAFIQSRKQFRDRKEAIKSSLKKQEIFSSELSEKLNNCRNTQELEDFYIPYKPRRKTKADTAIEQGLEPLAKMLMAQNGTDICSLANNYVRNGLKSTDEVIEGVIEIASLWISERLNVRQRLRNLFWKQGLLKTKLVKGKEQEGSKFKDYFDFEERVSRLRSHRFLAIYRAQSEGIIRVSLAPEKKQAIEIISSNVIRNNNVDPILEKAIVKSYSRFFKPSLETEVRNELKTKFDDESIQVFANNLSQLLLQAPLGGKRILAVDPGFKSGCKLVCLNGNGELLANATIYPHPPQRDSEIAIKKIATLVEQYKIEAIAIGNGTASRETETLLKNIDYKNKVTIYIVNEAGASVYSASKIAREEFPDFDVTVRGSVSIGRRLMDPLAELVKIDPKSIGVGQYQHDVNQTKLKTKLDHTIITCVNKIGVNLNTSSKYLLSYIAGIGPQLAENIVSYRSQNGNFKTRKELLKVPKLGNKAFEQASGFLRISNAKNPLDNSGVHPENYKLVEKICKDNNTSVLNLIGNKQLINSIDWNKYQTEEVGILTLKDIQNELSQPNIDPRSQLKVFEFAKINSINDLFVGMSVPGIVNNVTNFGAFVDIGIKENGLIHISELANEYVSNPSDVISLQQQIVAKIISLDIERKRINLSLKD